MVAAALLAQMTSQESMGHLESDILPEASAYKSENSLTRRASTQSLPCCQPGMALEIRGSFSQPHVGLVASKLVASVEVRLVAPICPVVSMEASVLQTQEQPFCNRLTCSKGVTTVKLRPEFDDGHSKSMFFFSSASRLSRTLC